MKILTIILLLISSLTAAGQRQMIAVVTDSISGRPLPFATVQSEPVGVSAISGLKGKFSIQIPAATRGLHISHIGYKSVFIEIANLASMDTIRLSPLEGLLGEVIIRNDDSRIRRILQMAIQNRSKHNPDKYDRYECHVYYQMKADLSGMETTTADSALLKKNKIDSTITEKKDSVAEDPFFKKDKHLLVSESYSKRLYKRPGQLQEYILASRFSGLKKTYFTNMITDVLPFHVYSNTVELQGKEFINPVAPGWQSKYRFRLEKEMLLGGDTVFLLSFEPRNNSFEGLSGNVYINSDGYALSHFSAHNTDTSRNREVHIEQIYTRTEGKWFPKELNYSFSMRNLFQPGAELKWNGHSIISNVLFDQSPSMPFNKAHPVILTDSVDLHGEPDWQRFRGDTMTLREANTFRFLDSISHEYKLETLMLTTSKLIMGRLPIGVFELDISRLAASNKYEGNRFGAGLYTGSKLSKYISAGGWFGYGTRDKVWKGGGSLTVYPSGNFEHFMAGSWEYNYRNPGQISLHPELDRKGLRTWVLGLIDSYKETSISAGTRLGYWEFRADAALTSIRPLYDSAFIYDGKPQEKLFTKEAGIGFRYAYGEKRIPVFDQYLPSETKYPIIYGRLSRGQVRAGTYNAPYFRALATLTYNRSLRGWGTDWFRLDGGYIATDRNQSLPRSLLLAGNGIRMRGINFYVPAGFLTMRPFDFYADRFAALMYRHDFARFFWNTRYSKPFLSIAHNMAFGHLSQGTAIAGGGLHTYPKEGYHESGILLQQLLRRNLKVADLNLNLGVFTHWQRNNWKQNAVAVFGLSMGF